jgi:hypothetical protein
MRYEFEFALDDRGELEIPETCVVCTAESPDAEVRIKTGWLDRGNPSEDIFHRHFLNFRCCKGCRRKALWSRALSGLATVFGILVTLGLMYLTARLIPKSLDSNWVGIPLIFVCVGVGVMVTKKVYSPIVVVSQLRSRMFASFRDESYAKSFEELNRTHIERV